MGIRPLAEELFYRKTMAICAELNNFMELKPTLGKILQLLRELTEIEAISIRLHKDGDYPYYVYDGFAQEFIQKETSLCLKNENGKRIYNFTGTGYLLDCMCGNIISGRYDPKLPFFTSKGSFWSNNTTQLLASTTTKERQSHTRNYCNSCGYESVALIPIKAMGEILGLIQLNDQRIGMFTEDLIHYLEMIGEQVGYAVKNSAIYTELLQLIELKDQLFSIVTHDIKNPFSALQGLITNIREYYDEMEANARKEVLDRAEKVSKSIVLLIDKLSEWNSIYQHRTQLFQECQLHAIITDVLALLAENIHAKQLVVTTTISPDIHFATNEYLLTLVVRNILSNAIKFTRAGGNVTITTTQLAGFTETTISDTGIGMNEKTLSTLFKGGSVNSRLGTQGEKGTGLGLFFCSESLRQMGGSIQVASEEGKGSSFRISLPM